MTRRHILASLLSSDAGIIVRSTLSNDGSLVFSRLVVPMLNSDNIGRSGRKRSTAARGQHHQQTVPCQHIRDSLLGGLVLGKCKLKPTAPSRYAQSSLCEARGLDLLPVLAAWYTFVSVTRAGGFEAQITCQSLVNTKVTFYQGVIQLIVSPLIKEERYLNKEEENYKSTKNTDVAEAARLADQYSLSKCPPAWRLQRILFEARRSKACTSRGSLEQVPAAS